MILSYCRFILASLCLSFFLASSLAFADEAALEQRIVRLERTLASQRLVEMLRRIEALQQDVQQMRGEQEELNHNVEGIKKRQRDLYLDIDQRLLALEQSGGAAADANNAATNNKRNEGNTATTTDNRKELSEYQNAFEILKARRYDDAIIAFKSYVERYPGGKYAANAKYWLGEANYVTRRFPVAIEELNKVLNDHPESKKVQDALLKIGFSYYELQQWPEARASLQRLVDAYPSSTAAKLAGKRISQMDADGR
ncbi:MAG: tol-pal system protein YbgF [Gammaproteobacteria bacterium]|nr:MAG: tol-pal system protein YbgF [Gammaproteobacteria bacterium]